MALRVNFSSHIVCVFLYRLEVGDFCAKLALVPIRILDSWNPVLSAYCWGTPSFSFLVEFLSDTMGFPRF